MGPRRVDRVESSHSRSRSPVGRRSAKGGKSLSKDKEDNAGKGKGNNMWADNVQDEEAWAAAVTAATVAWNQAAWDQRHRASPFVIDSNMQSPEDCYAAGVARGFALATGGVAGGGKGVGRGIAKPDWARQPACIGGIFSRSTLVELLVAPRCLLLVRAPPGLRVR